MNNMGMNNNMGNNMINNNMGMNYNMNNINYNQLQINIQGNFNSTPVFSSANYTGEFYIFSLDNYRLYFYDNNNNQPIPNFSISLAEGILYGNESPINYEYKLSGKAKFNIKEIELYSIQYGYL